MLRRSLWRVAVAVSVVALAFLVNVAPRVALATGFCDCMCSGPNGTESLAATAACTTRTECGFSACQGACTQLGSGFSPIYPSGGVRNYACLGVDEPAPATAPATPPPEARDTGTGQPTGNNTGSVGGTTAPTGGTNTPAPAGGANSASANPANAPAPAQGTLRLVLPPCTENGNCSLTDIINTGIRVANLLLALAGFAFLATVLWAGAQLLIFAYDAKSVSKARGLVQGAITGLVIIMVAGVIVRLVSDTIGVNPAMLQAPGAASSNTARPSVFNTNLGPRGSTPTTNP